MNQVFVYQENPVTFNTTDGGVMINLTEMAKPFSKLPADFLRLEQTKQFIEALNESLTMGNPIIKTEAGKYGGTWGHQKLALKFAAWLNPRFEFWVYDRIEELMRHGITAAPSKIEEILSDPDAAIQILTRLKEERAARLEAENRAQQVSKQLEITETVVMQQAPKVKYHDTVLMSNSLIAIDTIAHDLGLTAVRLNRWLSDCKIQYKENGCFVLYGRYRDLGLAQHKVFSFIRSDGSMGTNQHLYWTEKGRKFIHTLYHKAQSDAAKN